MAKGKAQQYMDGLAAEKRKAMKEAQNLDQTGHKHVPGEIVLDRDGREWTIQSVYAQLGVSIYTVTPIITDELKQADIGYVSRRVTDDQIDRRVFGFVKGTRFIQDKQTGEFVSIHSDFC